MSTETSNVPSLIEDAILHLSVRLRSDLERMPELPDKWRGWLLSRLRAIQTHHDSEMAQAAAQMRTAQERMDKRIAELEAENAALKAQLTKVEAVDLVSSGVKEAPKPPYGYRIEDADPNTIYGTKTVTLIREGKWQIAVPIDPGEGWEIVPEGEEIREGYEFTADGKEWHRCYWSIGDDAGKKLTEAIPRSVCDMVTVLAFRRRKQQQPQPAPQPASGWVSVEERLPDLNAHVLCFLGGCIVVACRVGDKRWRAFPDWKLVAPDFWMPLPEPPAPPKAPEEAAFEEWAHKHLPKWFIDQGCKHIAKSLWLAAWAAARKEGGQ